MATIEQTPGDIPSDEVTDGPARRVPVPATIVRAGTGHDDGDQHTGSPTASWRCGCSSSSDCLFFGAFIATYLLYRGRGGQKGPTPQDIFNIPFTSATSFILLMSSLTMVLALAAIQRGDYRRFKIWLMATALFGATFIAGQVFEFTEFTRQGLQPRHEPLRLDASTSSPASTVPT